MSITFNSDSSYEYSTDDKIISVGKWHTDRCGKIVSLIAEYNDRDGLHFRTTYLSIISLNENELILYRKEDIVLSSRGEFERKEFIQTFKKTVSIL